MTLVYRPIWMDRITTTIKRQWLAEIAAKRKLIEYRNIKPYWTRRLDGVEAPFLLRLINGMQQNAPELTVIVERVRKNSRHGDYELHLWGDHRGAELECEA
ncbi:MAG: hypothetical protein WB992_07230 [Bryobacteraceae bacterium]